ncbi:MAG: PEGA domain-containing protein, partial [Deltaproteobacteria bacterium]|nr:PEGA domain-containing protein [Deltaproteobacteria bacterium]
AGGGVGTIVVTSTPVPADIFLDGEPLGTTPVTRTDVPIGEHVLVARAPGYAEQAYRFELASSNPAHIAVTLQRAVGATPTFDAVIEVVTEPPGASVRIGGLPKGVTPLTIPDQDSTRPVILEIAKDGFQTEMRTVTFDAGQNRQTLRLPLKRVAASDGRGKMVIRSTPEGATVYIGRQVKGQTPIEVGDLDVGKPYEVEVTKDGFRPYREVVQFAGESTITLAANLEPLDKKPRKERKDKPREKEKEKEKPRPKGGACSGSAGKMGVMPIGVPDCKVTVGGAELGVAPFFKKPSPSGRCEVEVACPGGKKYSTVRTIRAGEEEKIIIKEADWE